MPVPMPVPSLWSEVTVHIGLCKTYCGFPARE